MVNHHLSYCRFIGEANVGEQLSCGIVEKKLDIFVPGFARHFLFRVGKQCELTIVIVEQFRFFS